MSDSEKPPLVIVAPTRAYREALAQVLSESGRFCRCLEAPTVAAGLDIAQDTANTIWLVDVQIPAVTSGIRLLVRAVPAAKVVVTGLRVDESVVIPLAEAGVSGYVPHEAPLAYLLEEIDSVWRGQLLTTPQIAGMLLRRIASLAEDGRSLGPAQRALTAREIEVLTSIAEGLANKEIARRLQIELQTVKNHVHSILTKLQVRRRTQAAAWAHREGLTARAIDAGGREDEQY